MYLLWSGGRDKKFVYIVQSVAECGRSKTIKSKTKNLRYSTDFGVSHLCAGIGVDPTSPSEERKACLLYTSDAADE